MLILPFLATALVATPAAAASPDASAIVARMKEAMEPAHPSVRTMTLAVSQAGSTTRVDLGEARGSVDGKMRILVVVLAPADLQGTSFLVQQEKNGPSDTTWAYVPAIGRLRRMVSPEAYSAFLSSDFALADLGFIGTHSTITLQGETSVDGVQAYRLHAVPRAAWYYSAVDTLVNAKTSFPIERRYFDPAGALWKVERWSGVSVIDGIPTPLKISMEDVQASTSSTLTVDKIKYNVTDLGDLLEPTHLPAAARSPIWQSLGS